MNIAVILAGGPGSRLGYGIPKQFFKVAGKMVIEHTIEVFETDPLIDEIAVVIHESWMSQMEEIVLKHSWKKVKKLLKGGDERYLYLKHKLFLKQAAVPKAPNVKHAPPGVSVSPACGTSPCWSGKIRGPRPPRRRWWWPTPPSGNGCSR